MRRIKSLLPGFFIVLVITLLTTGVFLRDSLMRVLSSRCIAGQKGLITNPDAVCTDSAFNYGKNKTTFSLTYLEFGSTGCKECKKMEKVMDSVKENYPGNVNVIFYNVSKKENKRIADRFSIRVIPVQILLDRDGKEIFRHTGYLAYCDLSLKLNQALRTNGL